MVASEPLQVIDSHRQTLVNSQSNTLLLFNRAFGY